MLFLSVSGIVLGKAMGDILQLHSGIIFRWMAAEDRTESHTMQHGDPQRGKGGGAIVTTAIIIFKTFH